jgi:predicted methyltransferase
MKMSKAWAMPSSDTFSIKPIKNFIAPLFSSEIKAVDPFVRNSPFKSQCVSNDIDISVKADFHLDALEFLKNFSSASVDLVLFDPPYSPRQVSECYKSAGRAVNLQTTQSIFWSNLKKEISRIVKPGGMVVSCGWNSGGIGKKYNFKQIEILLVAHGGWHNDTIVSLEKKEL